MKKDTQNAIAVSKLAHVIQKRIPLDKFDAEPLYIPHLHQALTLIKLAVQSISAAEDAWFLQLHSGLFSRAPKVKYEFVQMLTYLQNSLFEKQHRYTFWHTAALVLLTSYPYAKCIKEGRHQTVNLGDEQTLKVMEWDTCVLLINHLNNRIYEKPLKEIHAIVASEAFDLSVFFMFFKKQIEKCNETPVTTALPTSM